MSDSKPEDIQNWLEKIIQQKTLENSTLNKLLGKLNRGESPDDGSHENEDPEKEQEEIKTD